MREKLAEAERLLPFFNAEFQMPNAEFRIAKAGFVANSKLPASAGQSTGKSHFLPESIDIYTYI